MFARNVREQRIDTRTIRLTETARSNRMMKEEVRRPPFRIIDPDQAERFKLIRHRLRGRAILAQRHAGKKGKSRRRLARHLRHGPRHGQRGLAPDAFGHEAVIRQVDREYVAVACATPRLALHKAILGRRL